MTSASSNQREIAIVGVAESDEMGTVPNKSSLQHHAEAAHNALADAGLSKNDVNGLLTSGFSTLATAEYLGIQPGFTDSTSVGGSSFVIHVAHAAAHEKPNHTLRLRRKMRQTIRTAQHRGERQAAKAQPRVAQK